MLMRISLILAIVIGLAGVGANFFFVKPKLVGLRDHDKEETRLRVFGSIDDSGFRAWINWGRMIQGFFAFADGRTE